MIPETFTRNTEVAIATYDAVDIAAGLGYQTFYPFTSNALAVVSYHLSNIQVFSSASEVSNGVFSFLTSSFNLPRVLVGDAYIDIYGHTDAGTWSCSGSVILVHGDGTADTTLGTYNAKNFTGASASSPTTCKIAIAQTQIKNGDKLKLTIGSPDTNNFIYLDPLGAYSIAQTTKIHFPFKIDL